MSAAQSTLTSIHAWTDARDWICRCLLCPDVLGETIARCHSDLNRLHDHLMQAHGALFDTIFHCTHERLYDNRIQWRLPDGRIWLEVMANYEA